MLVDFPGARRCSFSSNGSTSGKSSGRNSVPGYPLSGHTPSSAGSSLSRYSSLTTPFYQPQPGSRQTTRDPQDLASTPVNMTPRLHSGTYYQGNSGSTPGGQIGPSPPELLPFGQLIPPVTAHSPGSNLSSYSYRNRVSPGAASPLSTPPSSSSPGASHYTGLKGALARRNNGTKLSALTEETGRKKRTKKGTSTEKISSGGFNIITQSCLLGFSEDEGSGSLDLEDENFPLSLNSSVSVDQEDGDRKGVEPKKEETQGLQSSGNALQFVGTDTVRFTATSSRPNSSTGTRQDVKPPENMKRRASSFSYERNPRLSQQLAALHSKASSLSAHSDPFKGTAPPSLSSEIVSIKAPFLFPASSATARTPQLEVQARGTLPYTGEQQETVNFGSLNLSDMIDSLTVVREMHAMAKARQGPILLLSTSADLVSGSMCPRRWRFRAEKYPD